MKYLIAAGWILAVAHATGVILKDNGTECYVDCSSEPNQTRFSYDSICKRYVECQSPSAWVLSSCWGDSKFDQESQECVPMNGTETLVCHPCAGYPPYERVDSDCPVDCDANAGLNISHSFDCTVYIECINETHWTMQSCPFGQKFSDAEGVCVDDLEGLAPTCHPCRLSESSTTRSNDELAPTEAPTEAPTKAPTKNSGIDLPKTMILLFITIIIVL